MITNDDIIHEMSKYQIELYNPFKGSLVIISSIQVKVLRTTNLY